MVLVVVVRVVRKAEDPNVDVGGADEGGELVSVQYLRGERALSDAEDRDDDGDDDYSVRNDVRRIVTVCVSALE